MRPSSIWASAGLLLVVCLPHHRVVPYAVYEDEYANTKLPGGAHDPRGLPNVPFTVDVNRNSDGVSSVSPLTTTSPAFPLYETSDGYELYGRTPMDDLTARRDHAARVIENQKVQGIAGKEAGEAEVEAAAYNRMKRPGFASESPPSTMFEVHSGRTWNPSGFAIQQYETYRIEVTSDQRWVDGLIETTADGYVARYDAISRCFVAAGRCRSYLKQKLRLPQAGAKWFQLVCGIGNYVKRLQDVAFGQDRFMPLREDEFVDTLFQVGSNVTFNSSFTGELVCFANDANGLYWNNKGYINATVTRLSWPPLGKGSNGSWPLRYRWPPEPYLTLDEF